MLEPTRTECSAYTSDFRGCVTAGLSRAEVAAQMAEALNRAGKSTGGEPIPTPTGTAAS